MTAPFPTLETFSGRQGDTFEVTGRSSPAVIMTLTTVTATGRPFRPEARAPFTVHFHGPLVPLLPQETYHFEHRELGGLDLFIVPLGPGGNGMRYEAVFG